MSLPEDAGHAAGAITPLNGARGQNGNDVTK